MLKQFILFLSVSIVLCQRISLEERDIVNLNQDEFASEALMAHNLYRKIHGVPPLKLNAKLTDLAVTRAKELAQFGKLNVKQILFRGENLGETVGTVGGFSSYNGISATQLWYSVVSKFDEEGESSNEGASFSQMVWKKTEEVGFGISKAKDGKFYFVAEYFPSGNVRGRYEENVFQLTDELMNADKRTKCVEQSVVDKLEKLLGKTTVEKARVTTPSSNVVVEEETKVEVPVKKLKSKLPVLTTTQSMKIVPVKTTPQVTIEDEVVITTTTRRPIVITSTEKKLADQVDDEEVVTRVTKPVVIKTTTVEPEEIIEPTKPIKIVKPIKTTTTETVIKPPTTVSPKQEEDEVETTTVRLTRPIVRTTTIDPELLITAEPSITTTTTRVVKVPVVVKKPVEVTDEVVVKKPTKEVTEDIAVKKPVEITDDVLVKKPVKVTEDVVVKKPVEVSDDAEVKKPVKVTEEVVVKKPIETSDEVLIKKLTTKVVPSKTTENKEDDDIDRVKFTTTVRPVTTTTKRVVIDEEIKTTTVKETVEEPVSVRTTTVSDERPRTTTETKKIEIVKSKQGDEVEVVKTTTVVDDEIVKAKTEVKKPIVPEETKVTTEDRVKVEDETTTISSATKAVKRSKSADQEMDQEKEQQ